MSGLFIGIAGAFIAVALAGVGSSLGIRYAGEAANAAMIEEPKHFGKYLVLTALPGTQGIYGAIIAFIAIQQLSIDMTVAHGLAVLFACAPIAIGGLFSGWYQGKVCASAIVMTVKHPSESGKGILLGVFVEFYAILGLLISILILNSEFMQNLSQVVTVAS